MRIHSNAGNGFQSNSEGPLSLLPQWQRWFGTWAADIIDPAGKNSTIPEDLNSSPSPTTTSFSLHSKNSRWELWSTFELSIAFLEAMLT